MIAAPTLDLLCGGGENWSIMGTMASSFAAHPRSG